MSVENLFEVFVHSIAFLGLPQQVMRPVCHIMLADFEPLSITPRLSLAPLQASPQVISVAVGKSCSFPGNACTSEHGSAEVACTISLSFGASTRGEIIGSALLRLPVQQAQCRGLCPIWLHKPQALALRSSATGVQTALLCISVRLVQQTQECLRARPEPSASPCPASSQASFSSRSRTASWGSPLSPLLARGTSTSPRIAGLHRAKEAWQQMRPQSADSAHSCPRPDTAPHACCPGQPDTCASRLGRCAHAEDACEQDTLRLASSSRASSSPRSSKGTIKGGSRSSKQHLEVGRGSHDGLLSDSHVIMSKKILRDLMADLAQGLADIAQLRQEALSAQAPLAQCNTSSTLKPQHDRLPAPSPRIPDNDLSRQCSSQGVQKAGMKTPQPHLQQHYDRASSKDGHSRRGEQKPGCQPATCSESQARQPTGGAQEYSYAQPTGHPMTLWRGALRSDMPLRSQPWRARPASQAEDVGKQGTTLQASTSAASESRVRNKGQGNDVHTSQENRDAAQQILPQSKGVGAQKSKHQCPAERPATKPLPGKEEHPTPASSPSLCRHLKQRYLPVYSVFDERGNIACDLGGQDNATHACSFGSHEAPLKGQTSPCSARQHAHPHDIHRQPSSEFGAEGRPKQSVHADADTASPEVRASKHQYVGEDKLKAALHAFAAKMG